MHKNRIFTYTCVHVYAYEMNLCMYAHLCERVTSTRVFRLLKAEHLWTTARLWCGPAMGPGPMGLGPAPHAPGPSIYGARRIRAKGHMGQAIMSPSP